MCRDRDKRLSRTRRQREALDDPYVKGLLLRALGHKQGVTTELLQVWRDNIKLGRELKNIRKTISEIPIEPIHELPPPFYTYYEFERECPGCKTRKPLTSEHWHMDNTKRSGCSCVCKRCWATRDAAYFKTHREQKAAYKRMRRKLMKEACYNESSYRTN
jgi:hypothetical protein